MNFEEDRGGEVEGDRETSDGEAKQPYRDREAWTEKHSTDDACPGSLTEKMVI